MSTDPRLQQATQMLRGGNKANARQLLQVLIREQPNNADLWYLMAGAYETPSQQIDALKRAIAINPTHARALAALDRLNVEPPSADMTEFEDAPVKKPEPLISWLFRVLVGTASLLVGLYWLWWAYVDFSSASRFAVDIGDVVLVLHAIFLLIAGIASLTAARMLFKSPSPRYE